jgi:DNA polymerase I
MTEEKKKLLLIDTFGLLYRFYYTLPKMKTAAGAPTNTAFGLARVLLKIFRELKPDYLVVAMESKTPTFRHEQYEPYKAHRDRMPDDMREQLPIVEELIAALGLAPAQADGYEADDVIGTLCRVGAERGLDVSVITGDKDLLQLVDENVRVMMSQKGITDMEVFDRALVKERMGVYPEHIPDKKGLEGDSSDNIPGVLGIGPKTAAPLLDKYGTIEKLFDSLDEIDKKPLREKLETNRETAFLSKQLATIVRDVPIGGDLETYRLPEFDPAPIRAFLSKYGFTSILREMGGDAEQQPNSASVAERLDSRFRAVFDEKEITGMLAKARERGRLCVDLETEGLDPFRDPIVGFSLAADPGDAVYVPVRHGKKPTASADLFGGPDGGDDDPDAEKQLDPDRALELLRAALEDPKIEKWGHNLKFDLLMLRAAGLNADGVGYDSILAAYLLDPSSRRYALKPLATAMLGVKFKTYEDMVGSGKNQKKFSEVAIADAVDYACADVDAVLRIEPELTRKLRESGLERVFREIEIPLVPVLAEMEWNGIAVDSGALKTLSQEFEKHENAIRAAVLELTGKDVNLNSPKQVAELLFDNLGLRKISKASTDISALEQLQGDHPVVPLIIKYRHFNKLRGTYVDALPGLINPKTGRIHTSFNQTLTATGRLSSSNPNLQNIPIRTDKGREIRRAFVPGPPGTVLLSADYSQIEIRLLAELSQDPILLESFRNKEDIHTRTAAEVFGVPPDQVAADQRRYAKTINFGLIYGMREFALSQQLGISRHEAAEYINNYFARYPMVREFIETTKEKALAAGYTTTIFGRRRTIEELTSSNKTQREAGLRAAFNARIQGSAADIIKLAMIRIHGMIRSGEIDAKLLLQVHDELVFEAPEQGVKNVADKVKAAMEACADGWHCFSVDLTADVKAGPNWLDMESV